MTFETWLLYLIPALIAAGSPGPAVILIMTRSIEYGWKHTIMIPLGNITALLIMSIISVSGLGLVLQTSETAFLAIKIFGAAYLIYMGIRQFINKKSKIVLETMNMLGNESKVKLFWEAFGVAISNPKAIIFLGALFPQFINVENPIVPQFSILILTIMTLSVLFLLLYSLLASTVRVWLSKNSRIKYFNRASGTVFCLLGIILGISI
jgi:homoserine/homoserine lactone efflux protein